MAEICIKLPDEFEKEILSISKNLEFDKLVKRAIDKALQEGIEEELLFEIGETIASKSKLSDKVAREFSEVVKDKVAKLHE
jgi:hypothetical protein